MRYFPLFFDLDRRTVLVAGGGEQAAQKIRLLMKTTARLLVVAPVIIPEIQALSQSGRVSWDRRDASVGDVEHADAVFVAEVAPALAAGLAHAAQDRGIPVNVVDRADLSNAIIPAMVDRDPLIIAIGTEGAAPMLATTLRAKIETMLPPQLGALTAQAAQLRSRVAKRLPAGAARRHFWRRYFSGSPHDAFLAGDMRRFTTAVDTELSIAERESRHRTGRVVLVGAGPGDPELLTLKAHRLLQEADVIVHDRLIGPAILGYARRDAIRIAVGKQAGKPSARQEDINAILIAQAFQGHLVVRLKGGDPYIFGRGSEEQEALEAAGIPFEVVPGITAAFGAAASVKIPLTRRGTHRRLTLITAMAEDGPADHDWAALAAPGQTLAVYMGVGGAARIARHLMGAGMSPATPVTVVENATLANALVVHSTVDRLAAGLEAYGIKGPASILIGAPAPCSPEDALSSETRDQAARHSSRNAANAWAEVMP